MTLLTIFNALALNIGQQQSEAVISSPRRECAEAVTMANDVGNELARRVDFGALRQTQTLTGDGTDKLHDLGAGLMRVIGGIAVTYLGATVRPLTQAEWASLAPVEGVPRYFLLEGQIMRLWPYLAAATTATVRIQSRNWCSNGTDEWTADTETSLVDENLMLKGLIARWRRQKGMPFEDYEAEYEADVADIARADDRARF